MTANERWSLCLRTILSCRPDPTRSVRLVAEGRSQMEPRFSGAHVLRRMLGFALVVLLATVALARAQGSALAPGAIVVLDGYAFSPPPPDLPEPAGGVIRVDPATGAQTVVASGGFFLYPTGVALEADGHVLVANSGISRGSVLRIDPATGAQTVLASGGFVVYPFGVAVEADGNILVADPSARAVIRVDPVTGAQSIVSAETYFAPTGIAVEANGQIVVADAGAPNGGSLVRVDPVTGARTTLSPAGPFSSPFGLAVDRDGSLVVAYRGSLVQNIFGAIVRVDSQSGAQTPIAIDGLMEAPGGVAIEANGQIVVADPAASGGGVIRIDPVTGAQTMVASGGSIRRSASRSSQLPLPGPRP
jgi:DNA-binding beta-propeller fold protein YncE